MGRLFLELKRKMNFKEGRSSLFFVLFFIHYIVPGARAHLGTPCTSTMDCPPYLTCLQIYEGCQTGYCSCHPHNSTTDSNGNCIPLLLGGEACDEGWGECRSPMVCEGDTCRCPRGRPLSRDRKHCLEHGARLVGERCSLEGRAHQRHKCFRETHNGFTQNDVKCSPTTKTCTCHEGFKTEGNRCLTRRLNERGCRTSIHCEGGAVCSGNRCVCPTGYYPDDNSYKCLRTYAEKNVELGRSCDEVNESKYCAPGLVCYRCAGEQHDKCIRFLLSARFGTSASRPSIGSDFGVVVFLLLLLLVHLATTELNCAIDFNELLRVTTFF